MKPYRILGIIFITISWLFITPFLLHWVYSIYQKKYSIILQKRYMGLSIVSCILCIAWLLFVLPLNICSRMFHHDNKYNNINNSYSTEYAALEFGLAMTHPVFSHGVAYILLIRFWMLYFYFNWTVNTLKSKWIHIRKASSKDKKYAQKEKEQQLQLQQQQQKQHRNSNNHLKIDKIDKKNEAKNQLQLPNDDGSNIINFEIEDNNSNSNHHNLRLEVSANWFILHRKQYGNLKWIAPKLFKIFIILVNLVVFFSVLSIFETVSLTIVYIIDGLLWLLPSVISVYLWFKTPSSHCVNECDCDRLFYRTEMKRIMILIIILMTAHLIKVAFEIFTAIFSLNDDMVSSIQFHLQLIISLITIFGILYYQTKWLLNILNKYSLKLNCNFYNDIRNEYTASTIHNNHQLYPIISGASSVASTVVTTINTNTATVVDIEPAPAPVDIIPDEKDKEKEDTAPPYRDSMYGVLFHVLQSDKLFNNFFNHLSSELITENIFAFVEFTQLRLLLERDIQFMSLVHTPSPVAAAVANNPFHYKLIVLASSIPRSSIVHNKKYASQMQPKDRYRKICKKLYDKYIHNNSEFELLIHKQIKLDISRFINNHCKYFRNYSHQYHSHQSHDTRSITGTTTDQSSNYSSKSGFYDDLYNLFEPARKEIYFTLVHSCDRFYKYEEYKEKNKK